MLLLLYRMLYIGSYIYVHTTENDDNITALRWDISVFYVVLMGAFSTGRTIHITPPLHGIARVHRTEIG